MMKLLDDVLNNIKIPSDELKIRSNSNYSEFENIRFDNSLITNPISKKKVIIIKNKNL